TMEESQSAGIIITVRLIKSFEYRTTKNLVLRGLDPDRIFLQSLSECHFRYVKSDSVFLVIRSCHIDTIKLYFNKHGTKSQHLIINIEHEDTFLEDVLTLTAAGIGSKRNLEVSYFNLAAYLEYKHHPETKW
ncbi:cytoplasmic protein, partial [Chytridium lagenaria]